MKLFKEKYSHELPKWLKYIGCTRICTNSLEFTWGYISFGGGPSLYLDHTYEYGIPRLCMCLFFVAIHIDLPFIKQRFSDVNESPTYGVIYHSNAFWGIGG